MQSEGLACLQVLDDVEQKHSTYRIQSKLLRRVAQAQISDDRTA